VLTKAVPSEHRGLLAIVWETVNSTLLLLCLRMRIGTEANNSQASSFSKTMFGMQSCVGEMLGVRLGNREGNALGIVVGQLLGLILGSTLGGTLGVKEGDILGTALGTALGCTVGAVLGE
jgi:hypothetical protein